VTARPRPYKPWVPNGPEPADRELQVLRGMSYGLTNGQIGTRLYLCYGTVNTYGQRLFRRIGANDRAHAVRLGFEHGWLTARLVSDRVGLPDRELQLLHLISLGLTYGMIAVQLCTTADYAKNLAQPVFRRLDARNRAHAVRIGFEHGLLQPSGGDRG
jgi:DNA-binding NarL/FixJ family response regulator